ncbi:uncharacterized protein LOC141701579 [Apium graveolens]|uniref:uncharacterized protein LOC141701579 n=1 Tax=Apium graveolens TaxID=4045 RepID=UPI003D79CEAD
MLPVEILAPTAIYGLTIVGSNQDEMLQDLDTVDELRDMAKIQLASYQHKVANSYNKNVHIRTFVVGNLVLRKVHPNTMDANAGKFVDAWEGPYFVDDVMGR